MGHFRINCPDPKGPTLQHWHAAKAKFRQEHPEQREKAMKMWEQRKIWQNEGREMAVRRFLLYILPQSYIFEIFKMCSFLFWIWGFRN
jgi:hypothetical protein